MKASKKAGLIESCFQHYCFLPSFKISLSAAYNELAGKEKGVYFLGRLANYRYFYMDDTILEAMKLFEAVSRE